MPTLVWTRLILRCDGVFDETLVVPASTTTIDARVGISTGRATLMPQKLSDTFKVSGLLVEQNAGAQVSELVRRQHDAGALF